MIWKRKPVLGLIDQKESELRQLQSQSTNALNLVVSTINQLSNVNQEIDVKLHETEEAITSLKSVEENLNSTKLHNSAIIEKFKALIEP